MQGVSWGLLAIGGRRLAQAWQDEERPATVQSLLDQATPPPDTRRWAPEGEPVWQEDFSTYWQARPGLERPDRSWIDTGPARWLAAWVPQHRFLAALSIYLLTLGIFSDILLGTFFGRATAGAAMLAGTWLTALLPWLLLAYVASRPLAEARRSGALELLLSTPLPAGDIVESHWQALWLQLSAPVKVCGILLSIVFLFWLAAVVTDGRPNDSSLTLAAQLMHGAGRVLTALTICRVGFYFSLKSRTLFATIGQTLFWAVAVPWLFQTATTVLIFAFVSGPQGFGLGGGYWFFSFFTGAMVIAYLIWVTQWAKKRLHGQIRELASQVER
jgi:hypothetical protein